MEQSTEKIKDTLLRFASRELTSHAGNVIGFAILVFSYLNFVAASEYFPRIPFVLPESPQDFFSKLTLDYFVIFLILGVLNTGIFFLLMRLIYYGKYANAIIHSESQADSLKELADKISLKVSDERLMIIFPPEWFSRGISELPMGSLLSLFVGFSITLILFFVFFCS